MRGTLQKSWEGVSIGGGVASKRKNITIDELGGTWVKETWKYAKR